MSGPSDLERVVVAEMERTSAQLRADYERRQAWALRKRAEADEADAKLRVWEMAQALWLEERAQPAAATEETT